MVQVPSGRPAAGGAKVSKYLRIIFFFFFLALKYLDGRKASTKQQPYLPVDTYKRDYTYNNYYNDEIDKRGYKRHS